MTDTTHKLSAPRWFPGISHHCYQGPARRLFRSWFRVERMWAGRLVYVHIRHHQVTFDFRGCWLDDLRHGETLMTGVAMTGKRMCVNCGRTVPATHPRHEPLPDCVGPDGMSACTFDRAPDEAWQQSGQTGEEAE